MMWEPTTLVAAFALHVSDRKVADYVRQNLASLLPNLLQKYHARQPIRRQQAHPRVIVTLTTGQRVKVTMV